MSMDKKEIWTRYFVAFPVDTKRKVKHMDYRFIVRDCEGQVRVTDLLFQLGKMTTGFVPANKEFLKRDRNIEGNLIQQRHYNGVIRGKNTIAVPNREKVSEEKDLSKRVTGGINFYLTTTQPISADGTRFSHQHEQREMVLHSPLTANAQLEFSATKRQVKVNGIDTNQYQGKFHTCPAGFGIYHVSLTNQAGKLHGSGRLLCEVDMWMKGIGGERM